MLKVDVAPFIGHHCETTATGTLLHQLEVNLSEPLLFGLGEGLSFVYWNMKTMPFPFLGGRVKTDALTANIARNLGLRLNVQETSSTRKAWQDVRAQLDAGQAVGLKLDCFHLEYFTHPIHFAGHYVAMLGYDDRNAFLVDTAQQGSEVSTSLESLERARQEKGPMSSRNLWYTLEKQGDTTPLREAVQCAIQGNVQAYLNPPIRNLSFKGIEKASTELVAWFDRSARPEDLAQLATIMERAGTGGALFRNLYRDFLKEAYELTQQENVAQAYQAFVPIAMQWTEVSALLDEAARTGERGLVLQVSALLQSLASAEKHAMQGLKAG